VLAGGHALMASALPSEWIIKVANQTEIRTYNWYIDYEEDAQKRTLSS
jgi:hypothetical protein